MKRGRYRGGIDRQPARSLGVAPALPEVAASQREAERHEPDAQVDRGRGLRGHRRRGIHPKPHGPATKSRGLDPDRRPCASRLPGRPGVRETGGRTRGSAGGRSFASKPALARSGAKPLSPAPAASSPAGTRTYSRSFPSTPSCTPAIPGTSGGGFRKDRGPSEKARYPSRNRSSSFRRRCTCPSWLGRPNPPHRPHPEAQPGRGSGVPKRKFLFPQRRGAASDARQAAALSGRPHDS